MTGRLSQSSIIVDGGKVRIRLPFRLRRRSGHKAVILPPAQAESPERGGRNEVVVEVLARAHAWLGWIETGQFASVSALAAQEGLDEGYVRRLLSLTSLAPDIVEALLEGREPDGLSIVRLLNPPLAWEEQRRELGFERPAGRSMGRKRAGASAGVRRGRPEPPEPETADSA